jgi:PKD domain
MRRLALLALTLVVSLVVGAGGAQAVVVDMGSAGHFGVALVPGTRGHLATAGVPIVQSSAPCSDPWLSRDLSLPSTGLCWHGGAVMHANETFTLTWDPLRRYWQTTRDYVQQFLRDVADGRGTLTSPYALTSQYSDPNGRANNTSAYGGGCIDFGDTGGSSCKFGDTAGNGPGHSYGSFGPPFCSSHGTNQFSEQSDGTFGNAQNDVCLTDAQIQGELAAMINQTGLLARTKPGYTPLVVLMTPPGVEVCLDGSATLCSANGASTAQFCSYHSQVDVNTPQGPTEVAYVVQPWTASWHTPTGCDEPDAPPFLDPPTPQQLATGVGLRLVSPLSQGELGAIVNPDLNGWFRPYSGITDNGYGSEINDNGNSQTSGTGCVPLDHQRDSVTVGSSAQNPYLLQREFNNAGVIQSDPNGPACAPFVALVPTFVVPSAVNPGDVVQFDGSTTVSTLIVPRAGYVWNFGDGTTAIGPSVEHSYAKGGTYAVKLTVTDRGGNVASLSQTITVLGPNGQPVSPPHTSGPRPPTLPALRVRLQFMPQGLRTMLRVGLSVRVSSNQRADGIATLSISRKSAKQAHIRTGRGPTVVIGRGTVSGITNGTVNLHLRLSRAMAAKLRHLRHVTLTLRLALVTAGGVHLAIDAAGRY